MSKADRIAVSIKCQPLLKEGCAVLLGKEEYHEVLWNTQPCNPPDLSTSTNTFCGLPLVASNQQSLIAIAVKIPLI